MKKNVIYARYSTEMQNPKSSQDQEHDVREGLRKRDIDDRDFVVLHDDGESGTKSTRTEFQVLARMIERGEVSIVAVDDQARLSRDNQTFAFIQDLVFSGGRFISTGEAIDTEEEGWELKVKVVEVHNSITISQTAKNVRRGQEGRLRVNLTAGDYPYGYESFYVNPEGVDLYKRGPRPEKNVRINENEAKWVRQVFEWYAAGESKSRIARKLTSLNVPCGRRGRSIEWTHQRIGTMLANAKYIGNWTWGKSKTLRNSKGKIKRVPLPATKWTTRDRPDLRIVESQLWDRVQARIQEVLGTYGYQPGQKKRGQKAHHTIHFPQQLLSGLLCCGPCGAAFHHRGRGTNVYRGCPNHTKGTCSMATMVRVDLATNEIVQFVRTLLTGSSTWLDRMVAAVYKNLEVYAALRPQQLFQDEQSLRGVQKRLTY